MGDWLDDTDPYTQPAGADWEDDTTPAATSSAIVACQVTGAGITVPPFSTSAWEAPLAIDSTDFNDDTSLFTPSTSTDVVAIASIGTYLVTLQVRWAGSWTGERGIHISWNGSWVHAGVNQHEAFAYQSTAAANTLQASDMVATGVCRLTSVATAASVSAAAGHNNASNQTVSEYTLLVARLIAG